MASGWTRYLEKKVLDHVFGAQTYTPEVTLYLALCTGGCTDAGVVTGEPTGIGSYARVAVTNNNTNFPDCVTDGTKSNGVEFAFPAATAPWGTITTYVWFDAATAGNALAWGDISVPTYVNTGNTPKFAVGGLGKTLD